MNENILRDNIMYLRQWANINPAFNALTIEGNYLVLRQNGTEEKQDISNFYFPDMLYNETFRKKLEKDYNAENLFRIVEVYCKAKEATKKDENSIPYIANLEILEENQQPFLLIHTTDNKKYRFDTTDIDKMISIYEQLKQTKINVTLQEFGEAIKNDSNK